MLFTILLGIVLVVVSFKSYIECYCMYDGVVTEAVVESTIQKKTAKKSGQRYYVVNYTYEADESMYHGEQIMRSNMREGKALKIYYDKANPEKSGILQVDTITVVLGIVFFTVGLLAMIATVKKSVRV